MVDMQKAQERRICSQSGFIGNSSGVVGNMVNDMDNGKSELK
jgi:hypothetical protein